VSVLQSAVEEGNALVSPAPVSSAEVRRRASSVTDAPATAVLPVVSDTESDRADKWREVAQRAEAWLKTLTTGGSLLHAKPPSLAECREHHRYAAGHFAGPLPRGLRTAYGYWHLSVKAVLHIIEWVLESPPRLVVAVIILGVVRFTV
jgi:hypothetical protein